ncbi:dienelactone hydrolase, partial [Burkholderia multivorans]
MPLWSDPIPPEFPMRKWLMLTMLGCACAAA